MMRTAFAFVGALVLTGVLGTTVIVAGLLGVEEKPRGIYQWCMHAWCRGILRLSGVRVVVHNAERMSETDGHVYIANHVSWYDIFTLASVIPRYTWIAKAELRRVPVFGAAAVTAGIVFIDRDHRKAAFESYKVAAAQVKRGRSIVICPEGTRGLDYHLRPFKKGPFVLAIASEAPIIPTIVYGTREIMPKGSFRVSPGTVHVHFLEPVETKGYDYDDRTELMQIVWTRMADHMQTLYGVHTAEHAVAPAGERRE